MNINRDKILEQIQKIMALAESTNHEGEREAALQKAGDLIAAYQVKKGELRDKEEIFQKSIIFPKNLIKWKKNLYVELSNNNGVFSVFWHKSYIFPAGIRLIGRQEDIDTVEYYFNFLSTQIEKMTNEWYESLKESYSKFHAKPSAKQKNDYRNGLIYGVGETLRKMNEKAQETQESWGLVPVDENSIRHAEAESHYMKNRKKPLKKENDGVRHSASMLTGFRDSKKLSFNQGVENKNETLQLGV